MCPHVVPKQAENVFIFEFAILFFYFFSYFSAPTQNFLAQNRVLLKTFGFPLGGGRALDVPMAETELADGAEVIASGSEFAAE